MGYSVTRQLHVSCDDCGRDQYADMDDSETPEDAFKDFMQYNGNNWRAAPWATDKEKLPAALADSVVHCRQCHDRLKKEKHA